MKMLGVRSFVNTRKLAAILTVAACALGAPAATQTYLDSSVLNTWNTTDANWDAGVVWVTGNSAIFGGTGETVAVGTVTAGDITINSTGYILSGGTVTLATTSTITANVNAAIGSALAGAATSLTKAGTGTLTISGTNTSGLLGITGGTLLVNGGSQTVTGRIDVGTGSGNAGMLNVNAGTISSSADTNVATSSGSASAITVAGGTLSVGNRLIIGDSNVAGNTVTLSSGAITVTNSVVFGGGGRGASTTGTFNLNGGTLSVGNALGGNITRYGNAGTYTFNFNGGTLKNSAATSSLLAYSGTGSFEGGGTGITYNVQAGGAIFDTTNGNATAAATLVAAVGNGGLTKNGGNTLTFSGIASSNAMNMTVNNGTLQLANTGMAWNNAGGVGNGGTVTIGSGATLDVNKGYNIGYAQAVYINGGTLNISNSFSGDGQNYTLNINFTGGGSVTGTGALRWGELADATITVNGTTAATISSNLNMISSNSKTGTINVVDSAGVLNFNGVIGPHPSSSSIPLTKSGAGTLVMSGANTYTSTTTLGAGTIKLNVAEIAGTSGPLGKSAASNPGNLILNGGYLQYTMVNQNDYSGRFSTAVSQQYNADTNGQNVTWGTALASSGGSLTKTGSGKLTLTGAASYTGTTTITSGTLELGGTGVNHSLSGSLTGSGALVKSGSGKLTLSGGGTYSGAMTVNGGTLAVDGTLSAVASTALASGAKLMGTGTVGGTVTVATGTGTVGDTTSTGTLAVGALTFDGTGIVNAGVLSTTNPSLNVTGALTLNGGAGAITLNMPTAAVGAGTYHLIGFGSGISNISGFTVGATPVVPGGRQSGTLTYNAGYVDYVITGVTPYWTGLGDGEWNTTSENNWAAGGSATKYIDATDAVTFDDTATGTTVNIASNVSPATVAFNNSTKDYTLTGAAGIAGTTGLNKSGSRTLTMNGVNSYSGATTISDGTLEIGGAGQLGSGAYAGNISNAGTLLVNSTANQTLSGVISGAGAVVKNNSGTLTIATAPTSTGAMTVNGGTLKMDFAPSSSFATPSIAVNSGATLDLVQGDVLHWSAGKGALTINGGTVKQSVTGIRQTIANTLNMTGGTLTSAGAGDSDGNYSFFGVGISATSDASGNAALVSANAIGIQSATGFTLNVTRGSASPASDLTISSPIINFTGVTGSMVKSGNGILTLTGANTYTGTTSVNAGTLLINGGGLASGGTLYVGNGGTGAMTMGGSVGDVNVNNGAIQVGYGTGGAGTLTVSAGTLRVTGSTVYPNGDLNVGTGVYDSGSSGTGAVVVNGGAVSVVNRIIIGDTNTGTNSATLSSGSIQVASVVLGGGNADFAGATTVGAFNLDGGTLTTGYVWRYGKYGTSYTFNFNGGTIRATADNTNFLRDGSQAGGPYPVTYAVKDGGAIFDTQAYSVTVSHALVADGSGGLTKIGTGTLTLSGANTYTGATVVSNGVLSVTGSVAGAAEVASGATLSIAVTGSVAGSAGVAAGGTLSGTGTVVGDATVNGTVSPGTTTPGTLAIGGGLDLKSTAALAYKWAAPTMDSIFVGGNLTLDSTLTVTDLTTVPEGTYTIITYGGALTDNGLAITDPGDGRTYTINTATAGQVKLVVSTVLTPYAQWWKDNYGVEPAPPEGGDYDGDGTPNGDEFAALTNPTDITSYLHLTNVAPAGNDMTVSVFTGGATYDLERTDDLLGTWTDVGDITGNDAIQDVTDTGAATGTTWFYRAKVK